MTEMLLEATERRLGAVGLAGTTTRTIARLAGVSVGSLYQYFPGRDALVSAIVTRRLADLEDRFIKQLEVVRDLPLSEAMADSARSVRAQGPWEEALYPVVFAVAAEVGKSAAFEQLQVRLTRLTVSELERRRAELRDDLDLELAAHFLVRGLPAAGLALYPLHAASCERLVYELARVALSYLTGSTALVSPASLAVR